MTIHARQHLGLPVVDRVVLSLLVRGGPLTEREATRLRRCRDLAKVDFRGESIANAVIRELVARHDRQRLPVFVRRPAALARLGGDRVSQSRTPARCECGALGPARGPEAIAAGWACERSSGDRSRWTCPEHVEGRRRDLQREHDDRQARFDRDHAKLALKIAPLLAVALGTWQRQ